MPHVTSIGLDVHARSVAAAAFNPFTGEVVHRDFGTDAAEIAEWALGFEEPRACYESGPTGFHMARELRALGLDCAVAAVSKMQRPAADARRKNDRRDAEFIARMLATHNIVEVPLPDAAVEAARDLDRALDDATAEYRRARQRLNMFLIRLGHVWDERNADGTRKGSWTRAHWRWISGIRLEGVSATVKTTNFAIALQPIPPTQFPQSRQRIFTISTNAGAYASTDKRTMLSGGAAVAEKNLIGELDMYREAGIKPNFSDIAKRYGKDRHTVAAYWRAEGGRPRDGRADRAGSFDAHIEEVAAKAQLPGVTKKGIHEWLLHRYPGEDLAGYNAFTQFMRKNGIAVGASVGPEPHPRFETPPGLQLQFDWKESVRMANRDGELFEFNVFAATLGHSRRHIFIRSGTRTTDDLVRCMYATIARLGGVPREWVTDNMSALVTVKGGRRLKVQRAYEFAKAAGFELKLCRPRSPQTKGKVESSNRFLSRLAAYQGDFDGWDDIDEIIARIEDASNSEPNETTGLPPSALFMEEKDALLPVGNLRALEEAMGDVVRVARVPATMLVSAHGEPMSVPRRCIGRPARIVCMPGGAMDCYVGGELVATHVAGGPAYDPAHYAEAMAGKRWFGDAAGDIEAAAAANLGLLDSIGGSL